MIDNTNVTFWEVNNYVKLAKQFNYIYMLIEPRTGHKFDAEKLFRNALSIFDRYKSIFQEWNFFSRVQQT